jgi:hypothetical protein
MHSTLHLSEAFFYFITRQTASPLRLYRPVYHFELPNYRHSRAPAFGKELPCMFRIRRHRLIYEPGQSHRCVQHKTAQRRPSSIKSLVATPFRALARRRIFSIFAKISLISLNAGSLLAGTISAASFPHRVILCRSAQSNVLGQSCLGLVIAQLVDVPDTAFRYAKKGSPGAFYL